MGAPLRGTSLVHELFAALESAGLGEEGTQALVKALGEQALADADKRPDS